MPYQIKGLSPTTWSDFEKLALKHNGVWGGCWCTWFHKSKDIKRGDAAHNRALKQSLVKEGKTHAALVYDGNEVIAWCQYGSPQELPAIYHKKAVETEGYTWPDYRITCLFVTTAYRKKGVAKVALEGALSLIAQEGGGLVEGYPQEIRDKKVSSSFLYNGTQSLYEACGFNCERHVGKHHAVMRRFVDGHHTK